MKIYMDVCCLFRPFDENRAQDRIRNEAEAVSTIVELCKQHGWEMLDSEMIAFEMANATSAKTAEQVMDFFPFSGKRVMLTKEAENRAAFFQQNGIDTIDSFHLALAEAGGSDVFLTTDDRFLRKASKLALKVKAMNPEAWIKGGMKNG